MRATAGEAGGGGAEEGGEDFGEDDDDDGELAVFVLEYDLQASGTERTWRVRIECLHRSEVTVEVMLGLLQARELARMLKLGAGGGLYLDEARRDDDDDARRRRRVGGETRGDVSFRCVCVDRDASWRSRSTRGARWRFGGGAGIWQEWGRAR